MKVMNARRKNGKQFIKTSQLTELESRQLWEGIKKDDPALADLMSNDSFVEELKIEFNATFQFELNEFNRFVKIGKQGINKKNGNT